MCSRLCRLRAAYRDCDDWHASWGRDPLRRNRAAVAAVNTGKRLKMAAVEAT